MSRLRAETMPAVTVPPRLNGLPMAITHSPSRSLSESPNFTALSGSSACTRSSARSALGILADQLRRELGAVVENDVDLVGVGDDVIVGDDEAGRIDDEAGAERVDAVRRLIGIVAAAALAAVVVLEELIEELLHRRAGRQIGQVGDMRIDFLRRRDIDDGVDDLFGDVGDVVGSARGGGAGRAGQNDRRRNRCDAGQSQSRASATRRTEKTRNLLRDLSS